MVMVEKYSGEREPYDEDKVITSLRRSGATDEEVETVLERLHDELYDGISTNEIYGIALNELDELQSGTATRYSLREALWRMGPEGFAFEKYVARLLSAEGYDVERDQVVQGRCIPHEIDVIARGEHEEFMVECKFHNDKSIKSHVHTPMYVKARFDDVDDRFDRAAVVTNTKFTEQAVSYASCQPEMNVVGWRYPTGDGLEQRVERNELWPVSLLRVGDELITKALDTGVVLLRDMSERTQQEIAEDLDVSTQRGAELQEQADELLRRL